MNPVVPDGGGVALAQDHLQGGGRRENLTDDRGRCGAEGTAAVNVRGGGAGTIAAESTNHLDRWRGWEAESGMRVASIEGVLTAATLISAIVVVLWGIKIFHGT